MKFVHSIFFLAALALPLQPILAQDIANHEITADADSDAGTPQQPIPPNYTPASPVTYINTVGSTYIPMDSWVYPALSRLQGLGYLDTAFL